MVASSGMTFMALPAWNCVTEITAGFSGSTLRATIDCSAPTICAPATMGSQVRCGKAAWPPAPRTVMVNSSADAITGPGRTAKLPAGAPGQLCMP